MEKYTESFSPRVVQVIAYHQLRGKGTQEDPYRRVLQCLDFDGNVIAEADDPFANNENDMKIEPERFRSMAEST